jgi:hypothetical protein
MGKVIIVELPADAISVEEAVRLFSTAFEQIFVDYSFLILLRQMKFSGLDFVVFSV